MKLRIWVVIHSGEFLSKYSCLQFRS